MDVKVTKNADGSFSLLTKAITPLGQRRWLTGQADGRNDLQEKVIALKNEADVVRGRENSQAPPA